MRSRIRVVMTVACLVAAPSAASAYGIVLEARVGVPTATATKLVKPIHAALAARGYVTGAKLAKRIAANIAASGRGLSAQDVAAARKFIASGRRQNIGGNPGSAIKEYTVGVNLLMSAPATMARDQTLRATLLDGLIGLGLAHQRLGHAAKATAAIAELLRSLPDRELSRRRYGPDAHKLYLNVRKELKAQGVGSLRVSADGAMIFVNERFIAVGTAKLTGLFPGRYRIYVQRGKIHGMVRTVTVEPNAEKIVAVPWVLDAALQVDAHGSVLAFKSEGDRKAHESRVSMQVARGVNATALVVVGVRSIDGRRAVVGTAYSVDSGKPLREGRLIIEPVAPSKKKLRALGRFLAGDESLAGMFAPKFTQKGRRVRRDSSPPWHADTLGWVVAGSGLAVGGVGVSFLASASSLDSEADNTPSADDSAQLRERADSRRVWGGVLAVTGGVALVTGIVRLVRTPKKSYTRSVSLVVAPRRVALSGRF